ncbi:MAG: zinc ribbon domain-containing protein [Clostridia bacterium]|nr:zinc ribbon domain-containing protein [Clostridia bacterium]
MIFCPKCGRELPDEASFCASCGAEIIMRKDEVPAEPAKAEKPVLFTEPAKAEAPAKAPSGHGASSIRETLGVPPAPVFEAAKPAPAPAPVREEAREEEPRRKRGEQPATVYHLLAVIGFAMAFVSPIPAIILSALAKSAGRRKRADAYSRLANWGLFIGIVLLAVVVGILVVTYTMWLPLIMDIFR